MARSWYRFSVNGLSLVGPMEPERAEALQAAGYDIEPAKRPADAAERVAAVVAALVRPSRPFMEDTR